jgi:hypothetical protein
VEAALITPLFFLLVLGIVELGLAMNDNLALANSVRAGARTASAQGVEPFSDYNTVQVVLRESRALNRRNIDHIVIYKPSRFGEMPTTGCQNGTPSPGVCNVYTSANWSLDRDKWGCLSTSPDRHWCPKDRKVSLSAPGTDYVGVRMKIRHPWVTKMFGNVVTLTDGSVIRLEPRIRA